MFPSDEDALEFLEGHGLDDACAKMQKHSSYGNREQEIHEAVVEEIKPIKNTYRRIMERDRVVRDCVAKKVQAAYRQHLERIRPVWNSTAVKIQVAYRRYLKRKSIVPTRIDAAQANYWRLLRERSVEMEWPNDSRYYLLFRVPLAYILVCLDRIEALFKSGKKGGTKKTTLHRYDNVDCILYLGPV